MKKRYKLFIKRCGLPEEIFEYDLFSEAENLVLAYTGACEYRLYYDGMLVSRGDGTTFNRS